MIVEAQKLIDMETLERVAPIIRLTSHPIRLRILDILNNSQVPVNVNNLTELCESCQAVVSQQLRILRDQGVVTARRDGNHVYYSISNTSVLLILDCIKKHRE